MYYVTLKALRKEGACFEGYNKLVRALQGKAFTEADAEREFYIRFRHDEPISIAFILNSNGYEDALWAMRCITGADRELRLFAVWCARQVQHLMKDQRSIDALDVAERFANGQATEQELAAAWSAASAAAWGAAWDAASYTARDAASTAAWEAARDAASAAARGAAWSAAGASCAAARDAAGASCAAARDAAGASCAAARDAAWSAARASQAEQFKKVFCVEEKE